MQKLKTWLLVGGIIYFFLLAYSILTLKLFNLSALAVVGGICFLLLVYYCQQLQKKSELIAEVNRDKHQADKRFNECNQSFNVLFESVNDGVAFLNLTLDFFKTNKKFCEILGYTAERISTWNLDKLVPLTNLSKHKIAINSLLTGKLNHYSFKLKVVKKSSEVIWLSVMMMLIRNHDKQPYYFMMCIYDVTAQKSAEDYLVPQHAASPLSQIPNRFQFEKYVNELLKSQNRQRKFAIFLIDVDDFKNINHTIGYEAGNKILQMLAMKLKNLFKSTDQLARLSSDEFVIVVNEKHHPAQLQTFANEILREIAKPIFIKTKKLYLTVSIGISIYPNDGFTAGKLLKHADIALNRAKSLGKNTFQLYSNAMAYQEKMKLRIKDYLSEALLTDKFYLKYQPRFLASKQMITCFDAQLELPNDHPHLAHLTLSQMIAMTSSLGLSFHIQHWLISKALKQLALWQNQCQEPIHLAIKCEKEFIKQAYNWDKIIKMIAELNLDPHCIQLEISHLSSDGFDLQDELLTQALFKLKQIGVSILLRQTDMNGFIFSPVKNFYFDRIILCQELIDHVADETSKTMLIALIDKLKKIGIKTFATNLQQKEQLKFLQQAGCDELQGDLLSEAMEADQVIHYFTHQTKQEVVIDT